MSLYVIPSFAIYSVNMKLYVYDVMTFLIVRKGQHDENENNLCCKILQAGPWWFFNHMHPQHQSRHKDLLRRKCTSLLQSEVCINHLAVIVVIWKSSVFEIVLLYFRSAIPYLLPNIRRVSLFFHKNVVCLIKKASVFVNKNKTSVCFLFFQNSIGLFFQPPSL